tara:strand:+ start:497 stop:673 length:177 start_codon:yes stop_codon:yes gene_type:complete
MKINKFYLFILFFSFTFSLDYELEDVNTTSETYQEIIGPSYFSDQGQQISINYFGWEN